MFYNVLPTSVDESGKIIPIEQKAYPNYHLHILWIAWTAIVALFQWL